MDSTWKSPRCCVGCVVLCDVCCLMAVLWRRRPLSPPGARRIRQVGCGYSCRIRQEGRNASVVPTAPLIFFQPLSSCLAYPGSAAWTVRHRDTRKSPLSCEKKYHGCCLRLRVYLSYLSKMQVTRPYGKGFPGSSVGKESSCNAGDPGLIPGSGRSVGEGLGYPLQYSWASLVA